MQAIIWKFFGQKYLLGWAVTLYRVLAGKRTLLTTLAIVAVYAAKTLGLLPAEIADPLLAYLSGVGGTTLLSKLNRWDSQFKVQERAAELRAEAAKRIAESSTLPTGLVAQPASLDPMVLAEAERLVKELQALRG